VRRRAGGGRLAVIIGAADTNRRVCPTGREKAVLYSPAHRLAFAHYPKTAGSAISVWFRRAFPDAVEAVPGEPHVGVRRALAALGGTWPVIGGLRMAHGHGGGSAAREVRIIGVVRSPFEMLVSLYEYWRRLEPHPGPGNRLIDTARTGTFRQFLQRAISGRRLPRYESFFDVGGPAWARTRLIHFDAVATGLQRVLDEFGVQSEVHLEHRNRAPGRRRPLADYEAEAGPLVLQVHRRFIWYHRNQQAFVRAGSGADHGRRAA
jgi:hypothetical protein